MLGDTLRVINEETLYKPCWWLLRQCVQKDCEDRLNFSAARVQKVYLAAEGRLRLVTKNALDARHKLDEATAEIVALKGVVTRLQKMVDQLQAAQKAAGYRRHVP